MNLRFKKKLRKLSGRSQYYENKNAPDIVNSRFLKIRWLTFAFILLIYYISNFYKFIDTSLQNPVLFYFCVMLLCGFNYYLFTLLKSGSSLKKVNMLVVILDVAIVTLLIQSFGKSDSPYFLLYYVIILGVNTRYESKVSAVITLVCIILYLIVSANAHMLTPDYFEVIFRIISLLLYFSAFEWARQFKKRTQMLNANIADSNNKLKEINEQLDEQKRQLDQKNKQYREMLSFVSHELKTPLTPIISISEYHKNQDDLPAEDVKSSFAMINSSANNMKNMIDKFLGLSKIERGEMDVEYRKMELVNDIIVPAVSELQTHAAEKNMRIIKHPASNVDSVILYSDPSMLTVIFNNLFTNAIKYGYSNTDINFLIKQNNDSIECSVMNFGDGIPPDKLDAVFEKFVRLDETKYKIQGTGLGLFNTRELIKKLNGEIKCESVLNHITTFTFWLPLDKGDDFDEY